jgi:hypothetical protein
MPVVGIDSINLSCSETAGELALFVAALRGLVMRGFLAVVFNVDVGFGFGGRGFRVAFAVEEEVEEVALGPLPLCASITIWPSCT